MSLNRALDGSVTFAFFVHLCICVYVECSFTVCRFKKIGDKRCPTKRGYIMGDFLISSPFRGGVYASIVFRCSMKK